jgi:hypothetical protein
MTNSYQIRPSEDESREMASALAVLRETVSWAL